MKIIDITRLAAQALRRYPLRSSMLLLAIAIGVAAVVALTAVGEGARRYVTGEFASLGTNMLIVLPGKSETTGAGLQGMLIGETARDLTLEDTIALTRSPRIGAVAPIVVGGGTVSWRARERDITVLGTTASMLGIQHWSLQAGRFLPRTDMDVLSSVCVLGHVVAQELFGTRSPLGQWLRIGDTRCRVIGLLSQAGLTGAFNTDEMVVMPVANVQQIFNAPSVFRILVEATSAEQMDEAHDDIISIIKARHQGEEDVTVIAQDAVIATFNSIFGVITAALAGIAGVSLVVAGVLIMNVMLVAVTQRTSEVGLLKALGAKERQILALFLTEASCLSIVGGLLGYAIGTGSAWVARTLYPIIDFHAPVWAPIAGIGVALLSGIVFGILPAHRAAKLDPVLALAKR
jgi:putative ABC transport system permease protein